jgi:hypothetical protein
MIRLNTNGKEIVQMEIKLHLPQGNVFTFLQKRGYEIKSWLWKFDDETFPNGITSHESWTFTATKPGEEQNEKVLYLNVFEKEMKQLLNEIEN